ncbi:MAG: Lysophospholipid transporter LplT [Chlamydiae bacterium]|nr:Lysophospholipid transporter LplT [Chlamydiota bacterium]
MFLFKKKKNEKKGFFYTIEKVLHRFGFFKKVTFFEKHAIQFLNISQFLGVVNDNFFKYLIVFLFIDLKGIAASPVILTWVGIVYVMPFLLFSSAAGVIADRYSKQRMIVFLKFTELIIMLLAIVAFLFKSDLASYSLLFLLSMQSAIFGPPKYSIIPELVKREHIPKANGLITSFTYFGIIIGTFLASFLTQVTNKNFPLTAGVGTLIAIVGFAAAVLIPRTEPKRSKKRINPFFIYEIYKNLKYAARTPNLLLAIFGSASFLFIGAYFQLNVIPFAVQSMGLTEVAGGYLFLLTAVGIACGALIAGRISHQRAELGMACFAGLALSGVIFSLGLFYQYNIFIYCAFFLLGLLGGFYIVPFDSFIQTNAPERKRGQIVAAANFLSFCGVLIAPLLLYLFSETLEYTAAKGFMITSIMIFLMVLVITSRLSGYFFNYLARLFVKPFYRIELRHSPFDQSRPFVLVWEKIKGVHITLLSAFNPKIHFYIPRTKKRFFDSFLRLFSSVSFIYVEDLKEAALKSFIKTISGGRAEIPCLLFPYPKFLEEKSSSKLIRELKKVTKFDLIIVKIHKTSRKNQIERKLFKRAKIRFEFTKKS